jgi:hypothetical protein
MGQKQVKRYRKVAEKVAKTQAVYLAQNQVMEIMKAPFSFRLKYCWKILFPPKSVRIKSNAEIIAASQGIELEKQIKAEGV